MSGAFWPVMGLIYALLGLASLVPGQLQRRHPEGDFQELRQRIRVWWGIVLLCTIALGSHSVVTIAFVALLSWIALGEYLRLIGTRTADRRVIIWAYLAIPVQYYWILVDWYGMFIIFVPVYVFLLLPVAMVLKGDTQGYLRAIGTLQWGLMITVFALGHVAYLATLPDGRYPGVSGAGLVLYLLLLTSLNDVAQYCWGKGFGRHRISPLVSPNKTVEGFLGGIVSTTLVAWLLAPQLTPLQGLDAPLSGLLIAVAGFFGDLNLSALKRDLGHKDTGTLLPGHGGLLDRLDSLSYTAPLFFHFCRYYYY